MSKRKRVGIVDYGVSGNLASIASAFENAGSQVILLTNKKQFKEIDYLVLPGVGAFTSAMQYLNQSDFAECIINHTKIKPLLGICLGMQLLATLGYEFGSSAGLNLIDAEVKKIDAPAVVPHVGFSQLKIIQSSPLFKQIGRESFYFMHSYEVINYTDVVALTTYQQHNIVASIKKNNIFGVQFHPEKSRTAGIQLLKNFLAL